MQWCLNCVALAWAIVRLPLRLFGLGSFQNILVMAISKPTVRQDELLIHEMAMTWMKCAAEKGGRKGKRRGKIDANRSLTELTKAVYEEEEAD